MQILIARAGKGIVARFSNRRDCRWNGAEYKNGFPGFVCDRISEKTGLSFHPAENKFAALAGHDALMEASGAMAGLASTVMKVANDIRWMGSGPDPDSVNCLYLRMSLAPA